MLVLSNKYGCCVNTIRNRLITNNVKIRSSCDVLTFNLPMNYIIRDYINGMNLYELGDKYNCSRVTIKNKLVKSGVVIRSASEVNTIILPLNDIIDEYTDMSLIELGIKYNCSYSTIRNRLIDNDVIIKSTQEILNVISICICENCGHEFEGKLHTHFCPKCNDSGYCYKYDKNCREQNRKKYNWECFFCGKTEIDNGERLSVHHIDYNKNQGCNETPDWKLVPLCKKCHGITGGNIDNRKTWKYRILYLHKEYWSEMVEP